MAPKFWNLPVRRLSAHILIISMLLWCVPVVAQQKISNASAADRLYVAASLDWQTVAVEDASFEPRLATAAVGFWMWEGIGLEAEFGTSYFEDSFSSLKLDVPTQAAMGLRLESPPAQGYSAYIQLGVARTEIKSRYTTTPGSASKTTLSGPRFGIGLMMHFNRWLSVDAGFTRLVYEDEARVNLFRLGLRFSPGRLR